MEGFSQKDLINKEHIKNLIAIALSDGVIDDLELELLQEKAEEVGISQVELDMLVVTNHDIDFSLPDEPAEKEAYLSEFVFMMMIDGIIHPEEYDICSKFAAQLDLGEKDLDKIIDLTKQLWTLGSDF